MKMFNDIEGNKGSIYRQMSVDRPRVEVDVYEVSSPVVQIELVCKQIRMGLTRDSFSEWCEFEDDLREHLNELKLEERAINFLQKLT